MTKRTPRREKILMDGFQLRLMAAYIVHFSAILLVFIGVLFVPLMSRINSDGLSALEELEAANQLLVLHSQMWPAIGMMFALLVLHSLVVSHRIAGPMHRFRSTLRSIGAGDLTRGITFRKNDYMGYTAEDINKVIESFSAKIKDLRNKHQAARTACVDLQRSLRERRPDVPQKEQELSARLEAIERWLGQFKLPSEDDERIGLPVDDSLARATEEVGAKG